MPVLRAVHMILAFAPLLLQASTLTRTRSFDLVLSEGNTVYLGHLVFESPARSGLECLMLCLIAECCVRVTYTGVTGSPGRCRGHSAQKFLSDQGTFLAPTETWLWDQLTAGDVSNLALNKETTQSGTYASGFSSKAVDGDFTTAFIPGYTCSHTYGSEGDVPHFWQVDLGDNINGYDIISVILTNRGDCCWWRLLNFDVHVYWQDPVVNESASRVLFTHYDGQMGRASTEELLPCRRPVRGRFVRVTNPPETLLVICEAQVMGMPVN